MSERRCGTCVHFNGDERDDSHGDCPFLADKTPRESVCERWFGMAQLRALAYGKAAKENAPQADLFGGPSGR